ncbi:DUF92 domain-containing protein [Bacillus aquiflavi]|uniref:DUF92 domain-containing protein n=1 Tax=Bacillus aquiflavi TaxID=2672567 RepID=UPI001FE8A6A6|nr:DUF92 domain-containing protein [Bacillus aquiflavi]
MSIEQLFICLFIIFTVLVGYFVHSLTKTGAIAAAIVGFFVASGFGINGLLLLGSFFVSSSLLSKFKATQKVSLSQIVEKGERRDWQQVFANGGVAAVASLLFFYTESMLFHMTFLIVVASSNADTWASEIGALSKQKPLTIKGLQKVEKGTSGAVSLLGTVAAFLGALFIAIVALFLFKGIDGKVMIFIMLFGFLGSVIDTLFGAFLQVTYKCRKCGLITEKKQHCDRETKQISGFSIVNNDVVNFLSGLIAAAAGSTIYFMSEFI